MSLSICPFLSSLSLPLSLVLSSVKIPSVCPVLFYLCSLFHFLFLAITPILLSSGVSTSPFFLFRSFVLPSRPSSSPTYTCTSFSTSLIVPPTIRPARFSSSSLLFVYFIAREFVASVGNYLRVFRSLNSIIPLQLLSGEELNRKIYRFFLRKKRKKGYLIPVSSITLASLVPRLHFIFPFRSFLPFNLLHRPRHVRAFFSILLISFLQLPSLTVLLVLSVCSLPFANALLDSSLFLSLSFSILMVEFSREPWFPA